MKRAATPGVGHQAVQTALPRGDVGEQILHVGFFGHVRQPPAHCLAAGVRIDPLRRGSQGALRAPADRHPPAFTGNPLRDAGTDPCTTTGHENRQTIELARARGRWRCGVAHGWNATRRPRSVRDGRDCPHLQRRQEESA